MSKEFVSCVNAPSGIKLETDQVNRLYVTLCFTKRDDVLKNIQFGEHMQFSMTFKETVQIELFVKIEHLRITELYIFHVSFKTMYMKCF